MDNLIPWRVGAWVAFGMTMIYLMFVWSNPLPLIPLIGLSYPAGSWLRRSQRVEKRT